MQSIQLIKETSKWKVEWETEGKVLIKTLKAYIKDEEVIDLFNTGYEQVKKSFGKKWMSDNRNLVVYKPEDVTWINDVWLPKMLKLGWKYWSVLEPKHPTGNISMKNFLSFYEQKGVQLKIFTNYEEALKWIVSI